MSKMSITFKKQPRPTGLSGVGAASWTTIKVNKKEVGSYVTGGACYNKDFCQIRVKKLEPDNNPNCDWFNIPINIDFTADDKAVRKEIKEKVALLCETYTLHFSE